MIKKNTAHKLCQGLESFMNHRWVKNAEVRTFLLVTCGETAEQQITVIG